MSNGVGSRKSCCLEEVTDVPSAVLSVAVLSHFHFI